MNEDLANFLAKAISNTQIAEVRKIEHNSKKIRLVMRIQNTRVKSWLLVVDQILMQQGPEWAVHFCKHYFRRGTSLIYAWEMTLAPVGEYVDSFESSIKEVANLITKAAQKVPRSSGHQIMEYPLTGVSKDRNKPQQPFNPAKGSVGQKGAYVTGKTNA